MKLKIETEIDLPDDEQDCHIENIRRFLYDSLVVETARYRCDLMIANPDPNKNPETYSAIMEICNSQERVADQFMNNLKLTSEK